MHLLEKKPDEIVMNPFSTIGKQWMLIGAGTKEKYNVMTASWGGLGVLWGKNVATIYVRPQRYTKQFLDQQDCFTLSFFGEEQREALKLCGTVSGRDCDKVKKAGLTPWIDGERISFQEATMVLHCRKLYTGTMDPKRFLDPALEKNNYPNQDYHAVYIGEVLQLFAE